MRHELIDVRVNDYGSVMLITPLTRQAKEWIEMNLDKEPWQWLGVSITVEPRLAGDLAFAMELDGLNVIGA